MDYQTYQSTRDRLLQQVCPYFRVVNRGELFSVGNNSFNIGGIVLSTSPQVSNKIEKFIGVTHKQTETVGKAFGERGMNNFRNYMTISSSYTDTDSLALVADPENRTIKSVVPVKAKVIAPMAFFGFLEMFMDKNKYAPDSIEIDDDGIGLVARLSPENESITVIGEDDNIIDNGLWFSWNPGEVDDGNYYIRQICSNGQTATVRNELGQSFELDDKRLRQLLDLPQNDGFMTSTLSRFVEAAKTAIHTSASLREVGKTAQILRQCNVPEKKCMELAPIKQLEDEYSKAGYTVGGFHEASMKSNMSMWDLHNSITQYASHTTDWGENDSRRTSLMMLIMKLLMAKRDIKEYVSIF